MVFVVLMRRDKMCDDADAAADVVPDCGNTRKPMPNR